jgi:PLD-like domain
MAITARGYANGDDCFLAWSYPNTNGCLGFEIARDLVRADGTITSGVLLNRVGFKKDSPKPYETRPSTEWPFQRYTWTDHSVGEGDSVSYTITPVMGPLPNAKLDPGNAATVGPLKVTAAAAPTQALFNRGVLMSQFISKQLPVNYTNKDVAALVNSLGGANKQLRGFLMGPLGSRLHELLAAAAQDKDAHVYAALYELSESSLIDALVALGKRAHVVLSNGSDKKVGGDGNKAAAAKLAAGKVDLHRRMLGSEGLGHNKFMVMRVKGKPTALWTGSTNWATTGLCTQMNNGILVEDSALAEAYYAQWRRLRDDHYINQKGKERHFSDALIAANDTAKTGKGQALGTWTLWFTRTSDERDLQAVTDAINDAKHAILFLMFEPGTAGILQVIQSRLSPASSTYDKSLYVQGVANTIPTDSKTVSVTTVSSGAAKPFDLKLVQPDGIGASFSSWAKEITREEFLKTKKNGQGQYGVVGYAIIHSKVIVIDPFTDPVVITGSHNFSHNASSKNDENLLIVRGNKTLAQRYIVNIMGVYQHYRWRAYVLACKAEKKPVFENLHPDDLWQKKHAEHDRELQFWLTGA